MNRVVTLTSTKHSFQLSPHHMRIVEEILSIRALGLSGTHYVLMENIPENDLVYVKQLDTWRLREDSEAWNISVAMQQHYCIMTSTVQRKAPDSFDESGKRTARNHSLVIFI
jgi:hypothetical protein